MSNIRVFVAGACGKMGMEVIRTILDQEDMEIVGAADIRNQGIDIGTILGMSRLNIQITGQISVDSLQKSKADILVDFTNPQSVFSNAKEAIRAELYRLRSHRSGRRGNLRAGRAG